MSDSTVTMIPVSSVASTSVQKGFIQIIASTRETEKTGKIEEANKRRCIVIPEFAPEGVPSKFQTLVVNSLERAAKDQLQALWEEKGNSISEVPAAIWTLDGILAFIARQAESQRFSKDNINAWLKTSELQKRLDAASNKDNAKKIVSNLLAFAAPVPNISLADCKTLSNIIKKDDKDATSQFGARMLTKIQERIALLEKQMQEVSEVEEV